MKSTRLRIFSFGMGLFLIGCGGNAAGLTGFREPQVRPIEARLEFEIPDRIRTGQEVPVWLVNRDNVPVTLKMITPSGKEETLYFKTGEEWEPVWSTAGRDPDAMEIILQPEQKTTLQTHTFTVPGAYKTRLYFSRGGRYGYLDSPEFTVR